MCWPTYRSVGPRRRGTLRAMQSAAQFQPSLPASGLTLVDVDSHRRNADCGRQRRLAQAAHAGGNGRAPRAGGRHRRRARHRQADPGPLSLQPFPARPAPASSAAMPASGWSPTPIPPPSPASPISIAWTCSLLPDRACCSAFSKPCRIARRAAPSSWPLRKPRCARWPARACCCPTSPSASPPSASPFRPLRQRREDIAPLAQALLDRICARYQQRPVILGPGALARLLQHNWPGNVRELAAVLETALLEAVNGVIRPDDLALPTGLETAARACSQPPRPTASTSTPSSSITSSTSSTSIAATSSAPPASSASAAPPSTASSATKPSSPTEVQPAMPHAPFIRALLANEWETRKLNLPFIPSGQSKTE